MTVATSVLTPAFADLTEICWNLSGPQANHLSIRTYPPFLSKVTFHRKKTQFCFEVYKQNKKRQQRYYCLFFNFEWLAVISFCFWTGGYMPLKNKPPSLTLMQMSCYTLMGKSMKHSNQLFTCNLLYFCTGLSKLFEQHTCRNNCTNKVQQMEAICLYHFFLSW